MNCVADDRHRRPLADRGSPGRTHGNAVTNPRIRVCSTVVLTALPPAPRTRSILPQPVPDNGMANPRPTSLTTNIRILARELDLQPDLLLLRRHPRSLLRGVEQAYRPALAHHVHRPTRVGQCMMLSAGWYKVYHRALVRRDPWLPTPIFLRPGRLNPSIRRPLTSPS